MIPTARPSISRSMVGRFKLFVGHMRDRGSDSPSAVTPVLGILLADMIRCRGIGLVENRQVSSGLLLLRLANTAY